jgi:hypothetical protein
LRGGKKTLEKTALRDARRRGATNAMTRDDGRTGERDDLYDALGVARDATKTEVRRRGDATTTKDEGSERFDGERMGTRDD